MQDRHYVVTIKPSKYLDNGKAVYANMRSSGLNPRRHEPDTLAARFETSTGYAILGQLVQIILDSDRLEDYEPERVIEAVEMAPDFFYDGFVQPMLDRMANTLENGFVEVDMADPA